MSPLLNVKLGFRNFLRNSRRYRTVLVGVSLLTALLMVVTSIFSGAQSSLRTKATRYFAGDFSLQRVKGQVVQTQDSLDPIETALAGTPYFLRTVAYSNDVRIYANGNSARLRRLTGVDPEMESLLPSFGPDQILVSSETASQLQISEGDGVLLRLRNHSGAIDTRNLVVGGIFAEGSFFAYNAYMTRSELNNLLGYVDSAYTDVGFHYPAAPNGGSAHASELLRDLRDKNLQVLPLFQTREERDLGFLTVGSEPRYAITLVDAQLAQLYDLIQYMALVVALFSVLFALIMFVGIVNSFQVIVVERTAEIGTMRAIGFGRNSVIALFVIEALSMGLLSTLLGIGAALATLWAVGLQTIPNNGWADLFTDQGRLQTSFSLEALLAGILTAVIACVFGCLIPAIRAAKIPPAAALRS